MRRNVISRDKSALEIVLEKLGFFVTFYPRHIEKEDKVFFPAMMKYLPQEEQESLLARFLGIRSEYHPSKISEFS